MPEMITTLYVQELQVAQEAVRSAARLCEAVANDPARVASLEKLDSSPVTVADFGSQALILKHLVEAYPRDPVLAEEEAAALRSAENRKTLRLVTEFVEREVPGAGEEDVLGWVDLERGEEVKRTAVPERFWTLDPIDGTKGFLRGEQYAIALALILEGRVELGVVGCPALPLDPEAGKPMGALFVAARGGGAWMGPLEDGELERITVSDQEDASQVRLVESVESSHAALEDHHALARKLGIARSPARMDSMAKYAAVARGEADVYLRLPTRTRPHYRAKIWDHAAGAVLVEEAGGRVTDVAGKPLEFGHGQKLLENSGMVVTNGKVHERFLEAIRELGFVSGS
jgi:3'(2'), 5'-bisphosphate nucleotidase